MSEEVKVEKKDETTILTKEEKIVDKKIDPQVDAALPDKYQGKTTKELADMLLNAEKQIDKQGTEVGQLRKAQEDINLILEAAEADPKLYGQLMQQTKAYYENKGGKKQDVKTQGQDSGNDDVRNAEVNRAIDEFRGRFKLNQLSNDKKAEVEKKIATELAEILDPGGTKSLPQILKEVRVDQLPKMLDKAYWLAHASALQAGDKTLYQDFASIGGMNYSSGSSTELDDELSAEEKKTAQNLGISPEKYAARKKKLNSKN